MFTVIGGTVILAFLHSLIPNHWLPVVAVARAEKWNKRELTSITFISALAHVLGTVILGLVLGLIGKQLQERFGNTINIVCSVLLILFGLIYYTVNLPHHHHKESMEGTQRKRNKRKWILVFVFMMFLSPCLEVESLFLTAGAFGMPVVVLLSFIYAIVSISGILLLVNLGFKGVKILSTQLIEQNEKKISGIVLIVVGLINFFLH